MDIQLVENLVGDAWVANTDSISVVVDKVAVELGDSGLVKEGELERLRGFCNDAFFQHSDEFVKVLSDGMKLVLQSYPEMPL